AVVVELYESSRDVIGGIRVVGTRRERRRNDACQPRRDQECEPSHTAILSRKRLILASPNQRKNFEIFRDFRVFVIFVAHATCPERTNRDRRAAESSLAAFGPRRAP